MDERRADAWERMAMHAERACQLAEQAAHELKQLQRERDRERDAVAAALAAADRLALTVNAYLANMGTSGPPIPDDLAAELDAYRAAREETR